MTDILVDKMLENNMWTLARPSFDKPNLFCLRSNMHGFWSGRYRIELTKLKRKVEGKIYKVAMFWTPYNPDNKVYEGRVNNHEEMIEAIKTVNKDLLDISRANR